MITLIAILQWLAMQGVSLQDFEIKYVPDSMTVYDCDGFVDKEATILVCYNEKLIRIIKKD